MGSGTESTTGEGSVMASYPKIWTTIEGASWWQSLDLMSRGVVAQMIFWCKKDGDTGHLEFRSWRFLAERLACHKDTCTKLVTHLATIGFIELTERPDGTLHIYLPKYLESQQAKTHFDVMKMVSDEYSTGQICDKIGQQQNRTEPKQTEPKRTEANDETPPFAIVDTVEKTSALSVLNQYVDENWTKIWKQWGNPEKGKPLFSLEGLKDEFAKMRAYAGSHERKVFKRWDELSSGGGYTEGIPIWIGDWLLRSYNKPTVLRNPMTAEQENAHYRSHDRSGDSSIDTGFQKIGDAI